MFKVSMAASLLLVSAAAAAHSGSGVKAEGTRAPAAQHSLVRFQDGQMVAAGKKAAPKAEEAKAEAPKEESAAINANEYKPKTQYDNTPYRFNMQQNGKKMTAEEFDAWMKSRGIRVAKGAPAGGAAPAANPQGSAVASEAKSK
ncbi:hypothetical protein [Lysobacter stagni]|uniref:hypothetical protein n=1 Tax=Lysobacter stagni TaxID=3045172 RepID=UPI0031F2E6FB